ncbi:hypothetical protein GJ744_006852 [Endocarpon pusillum]|uniref:Cyclin N-terminal domain-containing protein n=1 Tax=Endocarpon pusillum TaxID=364733 RepID=A0A8H7E828_9EURO|nr:hypothetical protein GJ744_006852 [Endocarpon pusillum]
MTGISLNQHNSNTVASQNYHPSKFPYASYPSGRGAEVRHHHNADSHDHNNRSTEDQQKLWSTAQEREDRHAPKDTSTSDSTIASYLQIPSSINNSRGSLAEFAAEITCLFWFESASTLQRADGVSLLNGSVVKPLAPDAMPTMGFLKWVTTILTTTQVTQNVILLALLFIYRLKNFNPGVSGKKGSEYRLLTIALMLGNKFLDDNTYTNKTWAEVSGISVSEIHIMEVEFLSNMRYNLYVSEEEWKRWHVKLARFSTYFNKASKAPPLEVAKPAAPVTPTAQTSPYKLPSPPSPARHGPPMQMYLPSLPNPMTVAPHLSHSPARHYLGSEDFHGSRKRSLEISTDIPAAKRLMSTTPSSHSPAVHSTGTLSAYASNSNASSSTLAEIANNRSPIPKLPMPNLPSTCTQRQRQHPTLSVAPPVTPVGTMPPNSMSLYANPIPALGELTRSQYASANVSPSTAGYGSVTPSLRSVNTLLIPPPSASLHNPTRNIGLDQMRYQPLGKAPTDTRAGVVPYMHHDAWPQPWSTASGMPSHVLC